MNLRKLRLHERLLVRLLQWILRLWWSTLRIRAGKNFQRLCRESGNRAFIFWHQNLFIAGILYKRFRKPHPMYAMISTSKDGDWLAELFRLLGMSAIRGSSHRGALSAYFQAIESLKHCGDVAITPDGPRGPKFRCKSGVIRIIQEASVPLLALRIHFQDYWSLRSWDGFKIPKPFSRITIAAVEISSETFHEMESLETGTYFLE
ncbi:MAG: lysophospholipid acyltransferase family protein, partial [Puniceicoccales bacterium]|nr:lysophospholipid acyltransferase family protein [Puniceicoccales bacterium]